MARHHAPDTPTTAPPAAAATGGGNGLQELLINVLYGVAGFVALCGFVISFASFKAFGDRLGFDTEVLGMGIQLSHLLPLTVDALAILATVTLSVQGLSIATHTYARKTLLTTVAVSAVINSVEHVMESFDRVPDDAAMTPGDWFHMAVTVFTGAIAPVSVAVVVHLLTRIALDRKVSRESTALAADQASRAQVEADKAREIELARLHAAETEAQAQRERAAADRERAEADRVEAIRQREERREALRQRDRTPPPPLPTAAPNPAPTPPPAEHDNPGADTHADTPTDQDQPAQQPSADSKIRAAIAAAEKAGAPFRDLRGSHLAKAAGVTGTYGRQILLTVRRERMVEYIKEQTRAGRTLGDILVVELIDRFGGHDTHAVAVLDEARAAAAREASTVTTSAEGR